VSEDAETSRPLPDPTLERLEQVSAQLAEVAETLAAVADTSARTATRERRTRRLAVGLAVSFALDVALTIVVSILSISALNQNATLHASQLSSCSLSNGTRADERLLWSYLFTLSGKPQTAEVKKFLAYVDKTFAPENCASLYE
jgi:hypothetical protein